MMSIQFWMWMGFILLAYKLLSTVADMWIQQKNAEEEEEKDTDRALWIMLRNEDPEFLKEIGVQPPANPFTDKWKR
jgi:hypothetical protein